MSSNENSSNAASTPQKVEIVPRVSAGEPLERSGSCSPDCSCNDGVRCGDRASSDGGAPAERKLPLPFRRDLFATPPVRTISQVRMTDDPFPFGNVAPLRKLQAPSPLHVGGCSFNILERSKCGGESTPRAF
jgi:hypothetical protein